MTLADRYYNAQRWVWRRLKPKTRGVKVMVFNAAGELLLIRNSYGDTSAFVLPGGGVGLFEAPEAAARREVREELSCEVSDLALSGVYFSEREGKRDSVWVFKGRTSDAPKADQKEVAEARFFALDALPERVSPATRRRIAEHRGDAAQDVRW